VIIILLKGSQILIEALKEQGVDVVFGLPGGAVLDIYHELGMSEIRHILVRHEQGAVHAADGYARVSGKVGVCIVTSGPGATNTVSGIATAYMDSSPIVVFTGQVPTALIGNDAFQEVDIVGITRPCTKHNYLVRDVDSLYRIIKEAFYIAKSGRPGPVLVDLPKDVVSSKTEYHPNEKMNLRSYRPCYQPNIKQLHRVVQFIKESKRPLILTGGGVRLSGGSQELRTFSKKIIEEEDRPVKRRSTAPGRALDCGIHHASRVALRSAVTKDTLGTRPPAQWDGAVWPVASTKALYCAFVTSYWSM